MSPAVSRHSAVACAAFCVRWDIAEGGAAMPNDVANVWVTQRNFWDDVVIQNIGLVLG